LIMQLCLINASLSAELLVTLSPCLCRLGGILSKYKDIEGVVKIEEVDGEELVKKFAEEMEQMLGRKMKSVKRLAEAAEDADFYHEYNETLEFDYYNSMLINTVDEDGNQLPLGGEFPLEKNEHFNKLPVNTQQSNIQVPTNVYNKDPDILNGVYMSETLNDVFIENFQKDSSLTWQYFGSATGFFRLYPGTYTLCSLTFRHFKLLIEGLHVKGEGKVKNAMKESFKILNEAAALGQGSLCNQAIMLITDGAMEDFQDVFEEFNWPERRENVMEYLHVLSRPMVINHDHDIIWTEAYMDSVLFNSQAQSLLLMTSVAMPVFSKKEETLSHGILLGVVGTDVALRELMRLAPRYKLGVHGYAFLITNNGYILSHPDLRPLYKEGKKLKPKPNYNSVDLSEVEWEDTEEKVSNTQSHFFVFFNDLLLCSLGIVLTRGYGQYIFIGNVSVEEGLDDLLAPDLIIANEWTYCETDIDPAHRKLSQLQAVVRYLSGKEPDLECDVELLQQTLFDAVVTAPMEAYWTALMLNTSGVDEGIETLVGFSLSLFLSLHRSFLTSTDKENMFTLDHFPVWYRRAAEHPAGQFLYYMPRQDNRGRGDTFTKQTHTHRHTNTLFAFLFPICPVMFSMSQKSLVLCSDAFRYYEADYSVASSAKEVEHRREAEEEEEGR
uniref:Calcium voltage-gated channel auxiliary subunit alpha2delta 4 n=1 Tax=Mastacembelus armatus TaxID=205130 RepID=A0A7N9B1T6_9TELE